MIHWGNKTVGLWKGEITDGVRMMIADILYDPPTEEKLGRWQGIGYSKERWPWEIPVRTNIGLITILTPTLLQLATSTGAYQIKFTAAGPPEGPLAEAMGLKK